MQIEHAVRAANRGLLGHQAARTAVKEEAERFKDGMKDLGQRLQTGPTSHREQATVNTLCDGSRDALRRYVASQPPAASDIDPSLVDEIRPYFMCGRTNERAHAKPLGYAGDFGVIELIYQDEPAGVGRLGQCVDRWTLSAAAGRAVRNRRRMVASLIREMAVGWTKAAPMPICSLASGPAREVLDVLKTEPAGSLHVTCVDIDPRAIDYASALASRSGVDAHMTFFVENVIRLAMGRGRVSVEGQQLIYSMGLIDYLPDQLVVSLLDWTHERLLPGGTAAFGNFAEGNPDRVYLEHILQWPLIHRSPDELSRLFRRSRFGRVDVDVRRDETTVQLFAVCRKEGDA